MFPIGLALKRQLTISAVRSDPRASPTIHVLDFRPKEAAKPDHSDRPIIHLPLPSNLHCGSSGDSQTPVPHLGGLISTLCPPMRAIKVRRGPPNVRSHSLNERGTPRGMMAALNSSAMKSLIC
jgi:hypothetical protein